MIGEKWLSDVIFTNVQSSADLSKVKRAASGDFNTVDLSRAVNQDVINELTVKSWQAKAGGRKSTMVFCVDIDHLQALAETFRKYGIQTKCVTGTTKPNERSQIVDDFRAGRFPVLLNCSVFTEGTDIPNIDCILLARPTRSRNLLVQMIGRGMRLFPGKKDCHVIDMASSLVAGIVTVPTLFGLHPGVLLENANAKDLKNRQVLPEVLCADDMVTPDALKGKLPKTVTFTDYDSIFDLISDRSTERHIRSLSKLAWVQVNSKRHILTNQDGSYISITCDTTSGNEDVSPNISEAPKEGLSEQPLYAIHYFRKTQGFPSDAAKKWRPIARAVEVGTASTLEDAVHAADTFAKETFPWAMMQSRASWRSADATEGQLKFLNKVRNIDSISGKTMTKGQAADMITKIKFGAQGRFEKMKSLQRQEEKEVEKEEKMRRKVEVKVGPVEK